MRPRFLSQNIDAKEPLKKIPSTAAKATSRCAKVEDLSSIHLMAQSAFLRMHGTIGEDVSLAVCRENWNRRILTGINGIEEVGTLLLLFNVGVNEKGVRFGVDVFHHDLKPIKAARLWYLDFAAETLDEVLVDDAIGGSKECQHVGYEVSLIIIQPVVPIVQVFGQIDLLCSPERRFGFLVHLPDLRVK